MAESADDGLDPRISETIKMLSAYERNTQLATNVTPVVKCDSTSHDSGTSEMQRTGFVEILKPDSTDSPEDLSGNSPVQSALDRCSQKLEAQEVVNSEGNKLGQTSTVVDDNYALTQKEGSRLVTAIENLNVILSGIEGARMQREISELKETIKSFSSVDQKSGSAQSKNVSTAPQVQVSKAYDKRLKEHSSSLKELKKDVEKMKSQTDKWRDKLAEIEALIENQNDFNAGTEDNISHLSDLEKLQEEMKYDQGVQGEKIKNLDQKQKLMQADLDGMSVIQVNGTAVRIDEEIGKLDIGLEAMSAQMEETQNQLKEMQSAVKQDEKTWNLLTHMDGVKDSKRLICAIKDVGRKYQDMKEIVQCRFDQLGVLQRGMMGIKQAVIAQKELQKEVSSLKAMMENLLDHVIGTGGSTVYPAIVAEICQQNIQERWPMKDTLSTTLTLRPKEPQLSEVGSFLAELDELLSPSIRQVSSGIESDSQRNTMTKSQTSETGKNVLSPKAQEASQETPADALSQETQEASQEIPADAQSQEDQEESQDQEISTDALSHMAPSDTESDDVYGLPDDAPSQRAQDVLTDALSLKAQVVPSDAESADTLSQEAPLNALSQRTPVDAMSTETQETTSDVKSQRAQETSQNTLSQKAPAGMLSKKAPQASSDAESQKEQKVPVDAPSQKAPDISATALSQKAHGKPTKVKQQKAPSDARSQDAQKILGSAPSQRKPSTTLRRLMASKKRHSFWPRNDGSLQASNVSFVWPSHSAPNDGSQLLNVRDVDLLNGGQAGRRTARIFDGADELFPRNTRQINGLKPPLKDAVSLFYCASASLKNYLDSISVDMDNILLKMSTSTCEESAEIVEIVVGFRKAKMLLKKSLHKLTSNMKALKENALPGLIDWADALAAFHKGNSGLNLSVGRLCKEICTLTETVDPSAESILSFSPVKIAYFNKAHSSVCLAVILLA